MNTLPTELWSKVVEKKSTIQALLEKRIFILQQKNSSRELVTECLVINVTGFTEAIKARIKKEVTDLINSKG